MTPATAVLALAVAASDFSPGSPPDAAVTPTDAGAPQAPRYAFRPRAAAAAFGGLVLVDAAVAGASLVVAASAGHGDDLGAGIALAGIITGAGALGVVYGPGVGATFASMADGRAPGTLPLVLAYTCQAAAVALAAAAISESGNDRPGRAHALLAGAAAVHFVGIPLALGLAREPPGGGAAPVATVALRFR